MSDRQPAPASRAVFLSYASQDAEAARRICAALRAGGVEVWFDADGGLEHGDEWDAKIRRQIKECVLFIPVISASTQARHEGYFRIEWDLAAERARGIASGVPFILPVVIDATREPDALVPDRFRMVQWTKLRGGEVPPEVQQRFLKLWSHRTGVLKHETAQKNLPAPSALLSHGMKRRGGRWLWPVIAVCLAIAGLAVWKFWPGTASVPRDPELARAAALFDFNSPDSTAEGFALADDILKTVLAKRPADTDAVILYALLNDLFMIRGFETNEDRRALARQYTERAVKLAPQNADALAARGLYYYINNDPGRAEQLMREAIALNPRDPRFHRMLSFTLADQGKRDEARRNGQHALELFPDNALVHYDYGLVQLYLEDFDGAEQAFRDTLPFTPPNSLLYGNLHADLAAFAAFAHADLPMMKGWLDQMPPQVRDNAREAMTSLIYALASGETERAIATVRQLSGVWLRNYGETPRALFAGDLLVLQGKPEQARGEFEAAHAEVTKARAKDPNKIRYRQLEVWTLLRLGRLAEARAALPGLIESTSDHDFDPLYTTEYWYGPLAASLVLGEKEAALNYLRKAAKTAGWRRYFRNLLTIDPRVKEWRNDPDIAAQLSDPAKSSAVPAGAADQKSVAVLAFSDNSPAHDSEYYSDGIADELINALGKVPGLKVPAVTSSFYFKGKRVPMQEIAQQLGVAYVIEGSVMRIGDQVKISARLCRAKDGFQEMSETFLRDAKDVFAVEEEIAGLIAKRLSLKLGVSSAAATASVNPQAFEAYLQGRQAWNRRTSEGYAAADAFFARALALDQNFARAYVGKADVLDVQGWDDGRVGPWDQRNSETLKKIHGLLERAIALDPDLAEAHASLGSALYDGWNYPAALPEARRAVQLNSNYATGWHWLGEMLWDRGEIDEALADLHRAADLDPFSPAIAAAYSLCLRDAGRSREALAAAERAVNLQPDTPRAMGAQAFALLDLGRKSEAAQIARQLLNSEDGRGWWQTGTIVVRAGLPDEAAKLLDSYRKLGNERLAAPLFALLGHDDEFLSVWQKYPMATNQPWYLWEPRVDPMRGNPNFLRVLDQVGLTEAHARAQAWRKAHPPEKPAAKP